MVEETVMKRALRIIGALAKADGWVRAETMKDDIILGFDSGRTIRCPAQLLQQMVTAGWLDEISDQEVGSVVVKLTEDGRSWRNRCRKGDSFAAQHRDDAASRDPDCPGVTINQAESPLGRLARSRGPGCAPWLDRPQLLAGERLRGDFEFAQMQPRITASWDASRTAQAAQGRGGADDRHLSERTLDARRRLQSALDAVGPELSGVLLDVCCFLKGLEQVETERGWPRRSAKVVLRTALDALDRHYNPPPKPVMARLRRWGATDYRPVIEG